MNALQGRVPPTPRRLPDRAPCLGLELEPDETPVGATHRNDRAGDAPLSLNQSTKTPLGGQKDADQFVREGRLGLGDVARRVEDLHQMRLAGPVLANQHVHARRRAQLEVFESRESLKLQSADRHLGRSEVRSREEHSVERTLPRGCGECYQRP